MKKVSRKRLIICEAVLGVLIIAMVILMSFFVTVGGELYPRFKQELDLTDNQLTVEEYVRLQEKLPKTRILWMIPLESGPVRSDAKQITLTGLSERDLALTDHLTDLETVYAEGCMDAVQLVALSQRRPQVEVQFAVHLGRGEYSPEDTAISVIGMTEEELPALAAMQNLSELTVAGASELSLVSRIREEYPRLDVEYIVTLGSRTYPGETRELTLKDEGYDVIAQALDLLPELKDLELVNPRATAEQLLALRETYPQTRINWSVEAYGLHFDEETVEMDLTAVEIDSLENVAAYADCLPNLEKLVLGETDIDNEAIAALRESRRSSYKVVWTIRFTKKLAARTDVTTFMPGHDDIREYRFNESMGVNVQDLKYFEDVICMDLGHMIIYKVDFLAYMPHLQFLILSWTEVHDISPIAACQELIYLELDYSQVRDLTPLLELKALEDLNICGTVADVEPLTRMPWLKNLWANDRSYTAKRTLMDAFPQEDVLSEDGDVLVSKSDTHLHVVGNSCRSWRHLPHYYVMRDLLGMHYMDQ